MPRDIKSEAITVTHALKARPNLHFTMSIFSEMGKNCKRQQNKPTRRLDPLTDTKVNVQQQRNVHYDDGKVLHNAVVAGIAVAYHDDLVL